MTNYHNPPSQRMLFEYTPLADVAKAKALQKGEKYYYVFFVGTREESRGKGLESTSPPVISSSSSLLLLFFSPLRPPKTKGSHHIPPSRSRSLIRSNKTLPNNRNARPTSHLARSDHRTLAAHLCETRLRDGGGDNAGKRESGAGWDGVRRWRRGEDLGHDLAAKGILIG